MSNPDYKGFACDVMSCWLEDTSLDGAEVFYLAKAHNLVKSVNGGFDPEKHIDTYGLLEVGDPYYELVGDTND